MNRNHSLSGTHRLRARWRALCASLLIGGSVCVPMVAQTATGDANALLIVDCALPGQVRQLGAGMTYLAPRRPIKTTASDCAIRGGEYVAYDRANLATALKVWLPAAEGGDKVAQTNVGEIHEKGLGGTPPDFASAAQWYRKAADQGYARALTNLGFLYEKGLGVARDPVAALRLYRQAAGIDGAISLEGSAVSQQELDALRSELERTRVELEQARRLLDKQRLESSREIERLLQQKQQAAAAGNSAETRRLEAQLAARESELAQQKDRIARLESDLVNHREQVTRLEAAVSSRPTAATAAAVDIEPPSIQIMDPPVVVTRDVASVKVRSGLGARDVVGRVSAPAGLLSLTANDVAQQVDANGMFKTSVTMGDGRTRVTLHAVDKQGRNARLEFFLEPDARAAAPVAAAPPLLPKLVTGTYYALLIGNQRYDRLPRLNTPEADVSDLAPLLTERYGFKVTVLKNATRYEMLTALNTLRGTLTEHDSLLIYYAGHGELDRVNGLANWLPIDAEPDSNANWISSSSLSEIFNSMAARHVLVVADSCFSGALTRSSIGQLSAGLTDQARYNWLKQIAQSRSRTALTSGGLKPVLDGGGGKYSVFASIFIEVLSQNQDVLEGMRLYREIAARVVNVAQRQKFEQRPEYGAIRFAGGESGDFLFVPRN